MRCRNSWRVPLRAFFAKQNPEARPTMSGVFCWCEVRYHSCMMETERLILRRFTLNDVDAAWEMNRDPEVRKYILGEGEPSREHVRQLIEQNTLADYEKHGYGRLAIVHKADNRFIGFTGLKFLEDMQEVDVGYRLMPAWWGQGLATEATRPTVDYGFQELGLRRVIAMALPQNLASIRVMEQLGLGYWKEIVEDNHPVVVYKLEREGWEVEFGNRSSEI